MASKIHRMHNKPFIRAREHGCKCTQQAGKGCLVYGPTSRRTNVNILIFLGGASGPKQNKNRSGAHARLKVLQEKTPQVYKHAAETVPHYRLKHVSMQHSRNWRAAARVLKCQPWRSTRSAPSGTSSGRVPTRENYNVAHPLALA